MSAHRLYKVHVDGKPVEGVGPFSGEDSLIEALLELNRNSELELATLTVHVYKTDATPLGIGRKYLGAIDGSTVLMLGEVDEDRVRSS